MARLYFNVAGAALVAGVTDGKVGDVRRSAREQTPTVIKGEKFFIVNAKDAHARAGKRSEEVAEMPQEMTPRDEFDAVKKRLEDRIKSGEKELEKKKKNLEELKQDNREKLQIEMLQNEIKALQDKIKKDKKEPCVMAPSYSEYKDENKAGMIQNAMAWYSRWAGYAVCKKEKEGKCTKWFALWEGKKVDVTAVPVEVGKDDLPEAGTYVCKGQTEDGASRSFGQFTLKKPLPIVASDSDRALVDFFDLSEYINYMISPSGEMVEKEFSAQQQNVRENNVLIFYWNAVDSEFFSRHELNKVPDYAKANVVCKLKKREQEDSEEVEEQEDKVKARAKKVKDEAGAKGLADKLATHKTTPTEKLAKEIKKLWDAALKNAELTALLKNAHRIDADHEDLKAALENAGKSPDEQTPDADKGSKGSGFSHWYWAGPLIAVVVIGVVAYFFLRGGETEADDESDAEQSSEDPKLDAENA